ncbi:MAG: 16S rRNA (adenine(1518)-N(6)/adenine(1519)-N(6))-dimethyltransferase RsmA [Chlamydiales bacterium]
MNLSHLCHFLRSKKIHPKKSLSQNFLVDSNIINKIIEEAKVQKGDYILEIGPGVGAITQELVKKGAQVIVVEKDSVLAKTLFHLEGVEVFEGDILEFPFEKLKRKAKIVSNLPFHVTAPILTRLVPRKDLFTSMTFIVQKEVAMRMIAPPNTANYGSLTLFLNFYASVRHAFGVSRHCFYPKPDIEASAVTLNLHEKPDVNSENEFFLLVRSAFQQRRKMIRNSLKKYHDSEAIAQALDKMGLDLKARAENLSLEAFLTLYRTLSFKQ